MKRIPRLFQSIQSNIHKRLLHDMRIPRFTTSRLTRVIIASSCLVGATYYYTFHTKSILAEAPKSHSNSLKSIQNDNAKEEKEKIAPQMENFVWKLQADIVNALENVEGPDGGKFLHDSWTRKEGGKGMSCVLQNGKVFEKAGVNVSVIKSPAPESMIKQMRARKLDSLGQGPFDMFVAGISLVLHPHNPMAPTVHLNYRYFELIDPNSSDKKPVAWWFGGGSDLTPSYIFEQDCEHFHKVLKDTCDKHDPVFYPKFKNWCDVYFSNTHRGESRGIGGIFFDDLEDRSPQKLFNFVSDCGNSFIPQYIPIIQKRKDMPYTELQKQWQQLRRGRYVEFNLVHDRGTKFGLATPGVRIESVLMSLPLTARWEYMQTPLPGSPEEKLLLTLKNPKNWVSIDS